MTHKRIHLAAHFPGVNNTTVWSDPESGSQIDFASFKHLAETAERGTFDFFFLAEGLRLREVKGRIHDLDVVGRPESLTVLSALAAVTTHLGLAATVNSTFNEPYELAKRLATLDHLSGGRAAWNVVTSWDAFTGENFRRGGYLDKADRYVRAEESLRLVRKLWDSWSEDDLVLAQAVGVFAREGAGVFTDEGAHFSIHGRFGLPRSPQGHPVVIQAGDSDQGRDFAAGSADVIFSRHGAFEAGQTFYKDVKSRLPRYGRSEDSLKIMPAVTVVVADTDAEAADKARHIREQQVSGPTAIVLAELLWGRDLSSYDPDGPLPAEDPVVGSGVTKGRVGYNDPGPIVAEWRAQAEAHGWSLRETVINQQNRQTFIGSPSTIAAAMDRHVQEDAADGFVLVPHLTPGGLDDFVDRVVPLLRDRGSFRSEYTGTTLRHHLGLTT
ncbi:FMN-dependent oxidoreductase (nitrilotriacetate monooxygenase family) [Kribbella orskensis]|uniref:FMN-dependent oxidoreductase (Nitrilotriacetate monooxygenase family) n=1 Tax=Kribbella orskensis TaxID=2512216 RepID=A0ABY2BKL6_9ACTN|nr:MULTISPECIES: NtaA/DmoA family FMN-dependent monooxygenase [Kribbella]TCN40542.1 FMN-dependent oxidoreductase (nitrilotriacetate monooxygenase family) [Kribbella sp. VKM Ac-2500]TCO23162.1 FMN-dependent oxidoreductase (nitrilotriacetate monooxygenase family) [Kribbella orskensis]